MRNMLELKLRGKIAAVASALGILALCVGLSPLARGGAGAAAATETAIEVGLTKPADLKPRELRFKIQGMIRETLVHEGDHVKKGQLLMRQDDSEEQAELKILQQDATDIRIQGAKLQSKVKQAELKRIKKLFGEENSSEAELEKAQAEADLAELNIIQEEHDLLTKQAKVDKQQLIINKMSLVSPMDGLIQSVDAHVGEMVDPAKPPVITIVENNPVVVDVNLPSAMSQLLKPGQTLRVSYDQKEWKPAKVSYLAPMADSSAFMQAVHLTLDNPEGRPSGLKIFVELPPELADAQKADAEKTSRVTDK